MLFAASRTDVTIAGADDTYQRRSYSVHKGCPLVKPMMLVATDGYILYLGLAWLMVRTLMLKLLNTCCEDIRNWFSEGHFLIVDSGFRDITE